MQGHIFTYLLVVVALAEGFLSSSKPKCQIKKYKAGKYIVGDELLVHEKFYDRIKPLEGVAQDCKVHLYIKGSYYQLRDPAEKVLISDADIVIGHGFKFEIRDEKNAVLCNRLCLSGNPMDRPEVRCFLQRAINNGFTWSRYNSDVLSDGTYESNTLGYQKLKTDIQTACRNQKLKREFLRALRAMNEEKEEEQEEQQQEEEQEEKNEE